MPCDAISKVAHSRGSGSVARGARGAERRESDTRAGVRVRYARLGARRGCAVGGGAWAWVGGGGAEDDRVSLVGCSVLVGVGVALEGHAIANTPLAPSPAHF